MAGMCMASRRLGASSCMALNISCSDVQYGFPLFYARASNIHSCYLGLRTVDFQDDFAIMSNTDVLCLNISLFLRDIVLTLAQKTLSSKNASLQHLYLMYRR